MTRFASGILSTALTVAVFGSLPCTVSAQQQQTSHPENQPSQGDQPSGSKAPTDGGQSPDTNQQSNSKGKTDSSHSPGGSGGGANSGGQSPDTQQEQNSKDNGNKGAKRRGKNNARQAHGTPQPQPDSQH